MLILTLRTDNPLAEIGLFENRQKINYIKWQAHRKLSETIHHKISEILTIDSKNSKQLKNIQGILIFKGPGSYTGLRIGMAVANALAHSLQVPIVSQGNADGGEDWLSAGVMRLEQGQNESLALPEYGGQIFVTQPKK